MTDRILFNAHDEPSSTLFIFFPFRASASRQVDYDVKCTHRDEFSYCSYIADINFRKWIIRNLDVQVIVTESLSIYYLSLLSIIVMIMD